MPPNRHILVLTAVFMLILSYAPPVQGKFGHVYKGIAHKARTECLTSSNFTLESLTQRENCQAAFSCVMENIDGSRQAILSSGSSILGFIPTILSLIGNTDDELTRLHAQYPILAFLLSIVNVNRLSGRLEFLRDRSRPSSSPHNDKPTTLPPRPQKQHSIQIQTITYHVLAALATASILFQTYDISTRAVLTWSCWTSFWPLVWLALGCSQHLLSATAYRLSASRPRYGACVQLFSDTLGALTFMFGTVVFSSLTLVSAQNAVKVLAVYGCVALLARFGAMWVLDGVGRL